MAKSKEKAVVETRPASIDKDSEVTSMKISIDDISKKATELVIKAPEHQVIASDMRIQIKGMQKKLKARLTWWIEPSQAFVKMMKSTFDLIFVKLDFADELLEGKMVKFYEEQNKAIRDEQEKLAKKNEKLMAQGKVPVPIPEAVETAVHSTEGQINFKPVWTFEILEGKEDSIPREYCSPDPVKIRSAISQGIRTIEGVRIFEETRTTRR